MAKVIQGFHNVQKYSINQFISPSYHLSPLSSQQLVLGHQDMGNIIQHIAQAHSQLGCL